MKFDLIGFDADDTLWHTEILYHDAQAAFLDLLSAYHDRPWMEDRLYQTEMRNLEHYGYGIKAFMLSMIETAIELTEGRVAGTEIGRILELGRAMLSAEVRLLPGAAETVRLLAETHPLMIITKGDLLDQEGKIARSGLGDYFRAVEVVSQKTPAVYRSILERRSVAPDRFLMVGNSVKSDILPVLELGGVGVYVPYPLTWAHELHQGDPLVSPRSFELERLDQLPGLIERLESASEAP